MPILPKSDKCSQLGCTNIRSRLNTYCTEHGGKNTIDTDKRKEFVSMYQTTQWRTLRQVQLSKQPLCESCMSLGKVSQASHVDHVFPWAKINKSAFYTNLFQSLCPECHSVKTADEQQGIFNHYATGKQYTVNDYQIVMRSDLPSTHPQNLLY